MSASRVTRLLYSPNSATLGLIALLIAAFALRVYQLDWDEGRLLHPDELHVVEVTATRISFDWPPDLDNLLNPSVSHLNPRSDDPETGIARQYAYGSLPVLVTDLVATLMKAVTGTDWTSYFDRLYKVGRVLSATFDTATVFVIYLLGRRLFNRRVGLYSATIYALAPMAIQLAHFYTTDSWLTFFVALTLLLSIRAYDSPGFGRFAAAGASCGLALATKGSVVTLIAIVGIAALLVGWRRWQQGETLDETLWITISRSASAGLAAIIGFGLFEPYALARPSVYINQLRVQSGIVRGTLDATYTRQYVGTVPFAYQFEQLFRWGIGPVSMLLVTIGVIAFLIRTKQRPDAAKLIIGAWLLLQGLVVVLPETKFLRYASPLLPALVILAGLVLDSLRRVTSLRFGRPVALALTGAALAGVFLWTASFSSVYAAPNTRLEASRWIYAHVPNGAKIGVETWDDALPVPFGTGLTPWDYQYQNVAFDLYGDRLPAKVADDLYTSLTAADYVVLASNRIERGVAHLPWRYPVQIRYYDLLTSEALGFHLVAEFERFPGIGSLRVDDQSADESFINYDHPLVRIYQKDSLVPRQTYDELMAHAVGSPAQPTRAANDSLLLDEPVGDLPVVTDTRWSASLTDNSAVALIVWVVLLVVLQFVGLPLTRLAFGRFAEGGWTFSRLVALILGGYLVWIAASVKVLSFRAIWCWVAMLIVASTWLLVRRKHTQMRGTSSQRRTAITGEAVFWLVFAVFLVFRIFNPDSWHPYWGGEKPMEFAHISAILRSAHFPPYDPWFADGYINYYYYGLYLVAFCIKLTGIPSEIAFNLAQPTMIALLASAGFGVAATLARRVASRPLFGIAGGLVGTVLLVAIGNLEAFVQVIRTLPDTYQPGFALTWGASRVIPFTINEFPFFTGLYADLHAHVVALPITVLVVGLCYAIASEPRLALIACSSTRSTREARLTLGVRLGLLVVTLGALFPTNAWDVPVYAALTAVAIFMATSGWRSLVFRLALSSLVIAVVGAASYLLYLPFHTHYVALFGSVERVRSTSSLWPFLDHFGGLLIITGFGLIILLLGSRGGVAVSRRLSMAPLFVLALVLVWVALTSDRSSSFYSTLGLAVVITTAIQLVIIAQPGPTSSSSQSRLVIGILAVGALATVIALASDRLPLGLMFAFAAAGVALWLRGAGTAERFLGAMVAAAASVAGGVEIVFLADDLVTIDWYRMNTVFKFYNQVWVLFALFGGAAVALMLDMVTRNNLVAARIEPKPPTVLDDSLPETEPEQPFDIPTPPQPPPADLRRPWSQIGLIASALVVLASVAYPLLATKPRLDLRFPDHPALGTLNALAWMDEGTVPLIGGGSLQFADDRAAIDWLNDNVDGSPVIAEASIGPYRCNGSRISIATGLPTIIGWERHETQQRYLDGLAERVADVHELYSSPDPAAKLEIIRRYDVRYVVVGQLERTYPQILDNECRPTNPDDGIAAFDSLVGTSLEVVFQHGTTTIYRVLPPGT